MSNKPIIFIFSLFFGFSPYLLFAQNKPNEKKLIEFGWDMPNVSSLKANIPGMEKMPFDGVVFRYDTYIFNAFDTTYRADSVFQYNDLASIPWKTFTDNFLLVRGASYTGAHWLNDTDWLKITENLKKVSKSLVGANVKGIGFDAEYYYDPKYNPWIYKPSLYNNLSYEEVGNYVRKRGTQFIQALQTSKPNLKVLCFWLLSLVYTQNLHQPIAETGMALYPFFIEGMLEGKNETSEIIDGNENSYSFQKPEGFVISGQSLRVEGKKLLHESVQSVFNQVSSAQAIFFDLIYAKSAQYDKGFSKLAREQWLKNNLYSAFKSTDKYVWFYNERINWWKGQVDSGVANIIDEVKNKINTERNNRSNQLNGKSSIFDFKEKQPENYQGFLFSYTKRGNILQIKLLNDGIKSLQVCSNSRLIYEIENPSVDFTINLNNKYQGNGNLIIMAKDDKKIVSVAYVN